MRVGPIHFGYMAKWREKFMYKGEVYNTWFISDMVKRNVPTYQMFLKTCCNSKSLVERNIIFLGNMDKLCHKSNDDFLGHIELLMTSDPVMNTLD